jgi:hypothetical protein
MDDCFRKPIRRTILDQERLGKKLVKQVGFIRGSQDNIEDVNGMESAYRRLDLEDVWEDERVPLQKKRRWYDIACDSLKRRMEIIPKSDRRDFLRHKILENYHSEFPK